MNITDQIKQSFNGKPCGIVYYYIYNQDNIPVLQHKSMHISSIDDDVKTIESMKSFIVFAVDDNAKHLNELVRNEFKKLALSMCGIK
jgi:hypothetical protein